MMSRSTPQPNEVRTAAGTDNEITVAFYVADGASFPTGLRATVTIPTTSGIPDVVDMLASSIPRALSGITGMQAANFLKDCVVQARSLKGYV